MGKLPIPRPKRARASLGDGAQKPALARNVSVFNLRARYTNIDAGI